MTPISDFIFLFEFFCFTLKILKTSCKMYTGYLRAKNYELNNEQYIIF